MEELKSKITFHQEKIREIKKDTNYKKLLISNRDAGSIKQLERYKLRIQGHETQIKNTQAEIARTQKIHPRRRIPQASIRHPPNPAKKYETEKKPVTHHNQNKRQILSRTTTTGRVLKNNNVSNKEIDEFLNGEIKFDDLDFDEFMF